MSRLLLAFALLLAACGQPPAAGTDLALFVCWSEPQAQALAAWPAGTRLALNPEPGYECAAELEAAKALWESFGRDFADPSAPGVVKIPIAYDANAERQGLATVTWDPTTGVIHAADIITRTCAVESLAHEIGHTLGFLVHATREGALMDSIASGLDVSGEELARLAAREANPAQPGCVPDEMDE